MNGIAWRRFAVVCALALGGATPLAAQQETSDQPGVYSHTFEGEVYLQKGSESLDLQREKSGFVGDEELTELDVIPSILANDRSLKPGVDDLRGCGVYEGSTAALSNQPLQSDFERFDRQILDEIDGFLNASYPPASVLLHATSMGISIDRAVYAAVRSQPARSDELYMAALELMAFLPGWSCTVGVDRGLYEPVYDVNDLPDARLIRDVADRYFNNRARLAQFPDWPNDEFHMLASADELLDLLSGLETGYWYRPGPSQQGAGANPRGGVLIGLYAETGNGEGGGNQDGEGVGDNGRIVIDTTAEKIRQWKDEGRSRIPVTFFYNYDYQRPVGQFDDGATLGDIMEAFFNGGEELTPVPLFTVGDYHLEVPGEELEELFDLPESDEISAARYQDLADDLSTNGFSRKPVLVSLLRSGDYSRLAEADRVRVALDRGTEQFPVAVFYHRLNREPCGAPASCFETLCEALVCGGGDPNACLDPAAAGAIMRQSFEAPAGGGGGPPGVPPGPPPGIPPGPPPGVPPGPPPASPS